MKYCKKNILNKEFIAKLPSYSISSILLRFTVASIIGILSIRFIILVAEPAPELVEQGPRIKDYLLIIFAFNLLSESNIILDIILERFLPIPEKTKFRLGIHSFAGITLLVAVFQMTKLLFPEYEQVGKETFLLAIAMGLIFVNTLSTSLILLRFMDKWVYAQKRIDAMKEEKLRMDYTVLQDQLNPHFLFNNLSVLKSLIIYDQETALSFTQNFTDVYRYVLKSKDKVLVVLKEELSFIDSYIALHKERLGEGIDVQFMIDKGGIEKNIAPLTLQLLVENAIKHNEVSKENPLSLEISSDDDYVIVKNNLQLKESSYSTKTGLSNLVKRYELLEGDDIIVEQNDSFFIVKVPLL
ncbi:MAG: histidine kinase [Bacteroidales bacterium]|nr:histidine kinase [Bacteroidales bacterium]